MKCWKERELLGALCVVTAAILFGIMPLLTKIAYQHGGNAFTVVFGRFAMAAVVLWVIHLVTGQKLSLTREQLRAVGLTSIPYGITPALLYLSYGYIDSGLATTLHFAYPVLVAVLLAVVFRVRLEPVQIVCTLLCSAGILLLYTPAGGGDLMGIGLALVSGFTFALYIVLLGRSGCKEIPSMTLTFWLCLLSSGEVLLVSLMTGQLDLEMDGWAVWAIFLLAVLSTVVALVLFQKGIFLCGEVKGSLLSTFEPLTGLAVGMIVFQEALSGREWLGVGAVLAAALILVLPKKKS